MALSQNYDSCDDQLEEHVYDPCPEDREFGRVRSVAFIREQFLNTLLQDPANPEKWQEGINTDMIIVLPETSGTYDPGEPKELKGYGDRPKTNGPRAQKLVISDPNYVQNYQFYNKISKVNDLVPAFRTSSQVRIGDVPASIFAKDPVEDDLEAEVTWQVTIDWKSTELPEMHSAAALDSIFYPTE